MEYITSLINSSVRSEILALFEVSSQMNIFEVFAIRAVRYYFMVWS